MKMIDKIDKATFTARPLSRDENVSLKLAREASMAGRERSRRNAREGDTAVDAGAPSSDASAVEPPPISWAHPSHWVGHPLDKLVLQVQDTVLQIQEATVDWLNCIAELIAASTSIAVLRASI